MPENAEPQTAPEALESLSNDSGADRGQGSQGPSDTDPGSGKGSSETPGVDLRITGMPFEVSAYILLAVTALAMRLWDLGSRAYHHDESLHAYYSWNLFQGKGFDHNPLLHGPFLFDVSALGFFMFGDNLVAPRVFPALFGAFLVLMPIFLRDKVGRWGALAMALMLAFSPSLLYFSRFIRNDIFTVVFDLGLIIAMWRYIETRKNRYLYIGAALLALGFSSKETTFITFAIVASFLLIWWSRDWLPALWSKGRGKARRFWRALNLSGMPAHAGYLILLATLTLPLLSAAMGFIIQHVPGLDVELVNDATNWQAGPVGAPLSGTGNYLSAGLIAGVLFVVAFVVGFLWRKWTWLIAFGLFYGIYFFLHTTFLTNMVGLGSGVWASLGYWIAQQSVERGSQPWYYYFIMLPLYELLPFSVGVVTIGIMGMERGRRFLVGGFVIAGVAVALAAAFYFLTGNKILYAPIVLGLVAVTWLALRSGGNTFDWFLAYWAAASVVLYIIAGEKMPWLVTHLALPFIVLSGRALGRLLGAVERSRTLRTGGVAVLLLVPVMLLAIRALVLSAEWEKTNEGIWSFVGALAFTGVALGVGAGLWVKIGGQRVLQMGAVAIALVLLVFSVRAGVQAAYVHGDVPVEMLVYTQTSPEIHRTVSRIDRIAYETGKGEDLPILIDTADGFGWPWFWYLRDYKKVAYQDMSNHEGKIATDVVVLNARNRNKIAASASEYTEGETVPFRQWFPEDNYRRYTAGKFYDDFFSAHSWSRLLHFYTYRDLSVPLGHIDSVVFIAREPAS